MGFKKSAKDLCFGRREGFLALTSAPMLSHHGPEWGGLGFALFRCRRRRVLLHPRWAANYARSVSVSDGLVRNTTVLSNEVS